MRNSHSFEFSSLTNGINTFTIHQFTIGLYSRPHSGDRSMVEIEGPTSPRRDVSKGPTSPWGRLHLYSTCRHQDLPTSGLLGPSLNKKVFPVHRPGGLKRADWDFFFHDFFKKLFFSQSSWYILVNEKLKTEKKKIPTSQLAFLTVTRRTGNNFFYLRLASVLVFLTGI